MVISLIGVGAALAVLATQNASFTRQSGIGSAIAQSQQALDWVEGAVRMAGTGIDPQMAFDFDFYKCVLPGGALSMADSAGCSLTPPTRDYAGQPDELVVAYRDPGYSTAAPSDGCTTGNAATFIGKVWGVTAATASTVTLVLKPGDTIYRGQVLQVVCGTDGATYTYATVSSPLTVKGAGACSTVTLNLYTAGIDVRDPFNQPGVLATPCFSSGGAASARAYAVRRNRFFIRRDASNAAQPHPYLMLDQGLDLNDDGAITDADVLPVAADILDFQVAYATEQPGIMALAIPPPNWVQGNYVGDANTNGVWGDGPVGTAEQLTELVFTAGTTLNAQWTAANAALGLVSPARQDCTGFAGAGFYQFPCLFGTRPVEASNLSVIHAYRWTAWPGNISQVQIGIVGMGPIIEEASNQTADELNLPALLNRSPLTAPAYNAWYLAIKPAGRKRVIVQSGVRPTNMALASPYWN
jgi:hypothetical protein